MLDLVIEEIVVGTPSNTNLDGLDLRVSLRETIRKVSSIHGLDFIDDIADEPEIDRVRLPSLCPFPSTDFMNPDSKAEALTRRYNLYRWEWPMTSIHPRICERNVI